MVHIDEENMVMFTLRLECPHACLDVLGTPGAAFLNELVELEGGIAAGPCRPASGCGSSRSRAA